MRDPLLIFLGGGFGSLTRWFLATNIQKLLGSSRFPWGILACNLLGSLLIGVTIAWLSTRTQMATSLYQPLLIVGFLGGFTTFSTFAKDTQSLFANNHPTLALLNILLSVLPSLFAVWLGMKLATSSPATS